MKFDISKGRYVVAVSGGVDSMVLLDLLSKKAGLELIIAHFEHGTRLDGIKDKELVESAVAHYGLKFEPGRAHLGPNASEEQAREARYEFLRRVKDKCNAAAIITAHHQDDLIETAVINILRGSGRRGLSSIADNPAVLRPLLSVPKKDIYIYAKKHLLKWREDPSNLDEKYLRNYIRRQIIPNLSDKQRAQLLADLGKVAATNRLINQEIAKLSQKIIKDDVIDRQQFTALPDEVGREVLMRFLRQNNLSDFDKRTIERLSLAVKTAKPGSAQDVIDGARLNFTAETAHLMTGVKA